MGFPLFRPAAKMKTLICHTVNVIQSADGRAVAGHVVIHDVVGRGHVVARLDADLAILCGQSQRRQRNTV